MQRHPQNSDPDADRVMLLQRAVHEKLKEFGYENEQLALMAVMIGCVLLAGVYRSIEDERKEETLNKWFDNVVDIADWEEKMRRAGGN